MSFSDGLLSEAMLVLGSVYVLRLMGLVVFPVGKKSSWING